MHYSCRSLCSDGDEGYDVRHALYFTKNCVGTSLLLTSHQLYCTVLLNCTVLLYCCIHIHTHAHNREGDVSIIMRLQGDFSPAVDGFKARQTCVSVRRLGEKRRKKARERERERERERGREMEDRRERRFKHETTSLAICPKAEDLATVRHAVLSTYPVISHWPEQG
jgi:hypothetical protein